MNNHTHELPQINPEAIVHWGGEADMPEGYRVADVQGYVCASGIEESPGFLIEPGPRTEGVHADEVVLSFQTFLASLAPHERVEMLEVVFENWCYDCGYEFESCMCEDW